MTGPWGMGPLVANVVGSAYDILMESLGPIFWVKPLGHIPTFSAWETLIEAAVNDIARETQKGRIYFRAWAVESGNLIDDYNDLLDGLPNVIFELFPLSSTSGYTDWETRSEAYSNNIAIETQRGRIYFRAWAVESGELGDYEDHMNDSEIGPIFKIEDGID